MSKPASYLDLSSGRLLQFAIGRESTLQIQNIVALDNTLSVNLFTPTTNTITLGSTVAQDLFFGARGAVIAFNQAGSENLTGFPPTVISLVGALNDLKSGTGYPGLQYSYDSYIGGGVQIALDDIGKDLIIETKDTVTYRNFILRKTDNSNYLRTDAQNSTLILGSTTGSTAVGVLLDTNLSWVRNTNDRKISLYNESVTQKRTLTIEATRGTADQYGGDVKICADSSLAHPDATGGGQVEIASKLDGSTRSYIRLNQDGSAIDHGILIDSYGRLDLAVDVGSPANSPLNIDNSIGPTTITATGGTFSINATGQPTTIDCAAFDIDASTTSSIACSAALTVSAVNNLILGGLGTSITLNQAGAENLAPGFTATSIVGALNEILGSGGLGTLLQQAYNLGNTINLTTNRNLQFTTWDGAGPSNLVVRNFLGRVYLQTDTVNSAVKIGDVLLNDVIISGRGASLTFNQAGNIALSGFAVSTTSLVAALNELKASTSIGVSAVYTTAESVEIGDALYMTAAGTVGVADYTSVDGKDNVLGFSTETKGSGVDCVVVLAGNVLVKSTLSAGDRGKPAFLNTDGDVSAVAPPPTSEGLTLARVGLITSSGSGTSKISIQIGTPVLL